MGLYLSKNHLNRDTLQTPNLPDEIKSIEMKTKSFSLHKKSDWFKSIETQMGLYFIYKSFKWCLPIKNRLENMFRKSDGILFMEDQMVQKYF